MKILTMKMAMLLALLSATTAYGQIRPIIDDGDDCLGCGPTTTVSLSGTTNVNLNSTYAYTVSVSSGLHSASNYSVSGGQIISQSRNSVSVKWTSTGSRWVRVTATVSGSLYTSTKSVVVTAPLVGGSVSASTTTSICSGINPGVINNSQAASGGSGSISYQWQVLSDGGVLEQSLEGPIDGGSGTSWNNISGATSATYDPPKLYQNTSYRRRAKSGTQTSYSNTINYQVAAPLNKGSISYSGGAVNPGVKPSKISGTTATGGNGISYRWQWKQGTATSFTNIPTNLGSSVTSRDYQPQGLTKKTVFRRRVTSCGQNQYTNQVTINVNLLPGSISGNQTICPGGDPSNISSTAAASGGNGSYSYKWEKREYRPSSDSPIEPVGLEGGGSTNPAPTTTYVWTGWTQVGSGTTYNPGTQTFKTQYRRKVTSNGSTKYSNVVTKNVYSSAVPGSISYTGGAISSGSTPSRINGTTGSGGTSVTYQWQKKTTGGYSNITGATGKNYQSGSLTRTTSFKRLTTTNCGITAESNAITIHVNLNPGSIASGSETICRGSNPGTINSSAAASGGVGNYKYQWQVFSDLNLSEIESLEGGGSIQDSWHDLTGETNQTFDPPALTMNMAYRRKVTSGSEVAYTAAKSYSVSTPLTAGSISYTGGAVNADGNPPNIAGTTPTGGLSLDYQWQQKVGNASNYTNISGAKGKDYNPPAGIDYTTSYKRRVKSCGETKFSNVVTVTVNFSAGSISGNQTICPGSNPSIITSTSPANGGKGGYTYTWLKREYKPLDSTPEENPFEGGGESVETPTTQYAWTGWVSVGTGTSHDPDPVHYKTQYKRKVVSGGVTKYSNVITKNVYAPAEAGTISYSGGAINPGGTPSQSITGSAGAGGSSVSYQWQSRTNGSYSNITGATNQNYQPGSLNRTTTFQRLTTTNCGSTAASNEIQIKVNLNPGSIASGNETICRGSNPALISSNAPASGGVGNYQYQWQVFTDLVLNPNESLEGGGAIENQWHDIEGETNQTFDPPSLAMNMTYRRKVTSGTEEAFTAAKSYTVSAPLTAGSISYSGGAVNPDADPSTISGTTPTGGLTLDYQWQRKVGNAASFSNISGAKSKNYNPPAGIDYTTVYKRRVKSCGETKFSNPITITVNFSPGSISGNQTICAGENPTAITSNSPAKGGLGGYDYQWEKSEYKPIDIVLNDQPLEPNPNQIEQATYAWTGWVDAIGEKNVSIDPSNLNYATRYRRKVVSGGVSKYSNVIEISIHELPEPGNISYAGGTITAGSTPATIKGSAVTSSSSFQYKWQKKTGSLFVDIPSANTRDLAPGSLNVSTTFKRLVINTCGLIVESNTVKVPVLLVEGSPSTSNIAICHDCSVPTLSVSNPIGGSGSYSYQWQIQGPELVTEIPVNEDGELIPVAGYGEFKDVLNAKGADYTPDIIWIGTRRFRRKVVSDGQTKYSEPIEFTIYPPLNAGTISYDLADPCDGSNVGNITGSQPTGGNQVYEYQWQYYTGTEWSAFNSSNAQSFNPDFTITADTKFRRRVRSAGSNWKKSNEITIEVYEVITNIGSLSAPNDQLCPAGLVTFTYHPTTGVNTNKTRLFGVKDGNETDFGVIKNQKSIHVNEGYTYYVKYLQRCTPVDYSTNTKTFSFFENCNVPPSLDQNFVRVEVPKIPVTTQSSLSTLDATEKMTSYSYTDGLGRSTVQVITSAGENFEDGIQFNKYNEEGRQDKSYMSYYRTAHAPGKYVDPDEAINDQLSFYSNEENIAHDSKPYSKTEWDARGRVKSIIAPGAAWHDNDKKTTYSHVIYDPSKANGNPWSVHTEVVKWKIESGLPKQNGTYAAKELSITVTTNVEGIKTRQVSDVRGRIITSQVYDKDQKKWIGSYNVYDDLNRVRFIVPPLMSDIEVPTQNQVDELAYQKVYDNKGRISEESSPGAGWIRYVYDHWNRLVLTRHSGQVTDGDKYWSFFKYDALNREIMTGVIHDERGRDQLQTLLDGITSNGARYETVNNTSSRGYTKYKTFPDLNNDYTSSDYEIHSFSYFDNYDFITYPNWDQEGHSFGFSQPAGFSGLKSNSVTDRTTGSKIKLLGSNTWLNTVVYYDEYGRVIQTISENHKGGIDRFTNELNWNGELLKKEHDHTSTTDEVNLLYEYEYAHNGQLKNIFQTVSNSSIAGERILLSQYTYNVLGELIERNLHSTNDNEFLQSIDYRYNIRGALTRINNTNLTDGEGDIFGMEYHYENPININGVNTTARYDGMVNAISWNVDDESIEGAGFEKTAIGFVYDKQTRLKSTTYGTGSALNNNSDAYSMSVGNYDDNGNIQSLSRNAEGQQIDQLSYSYEPNSNKLSGVSDSSSDPEGLDDYYPGTDYDYDVMGNMTSDLNKQIVAIKYNHFQLIDEIEFGDGTVLKYTYDGARNRLAKEILDADNNQIARVDYIGLIEYLDDEINQILIPEGRIYAQNDKYHNEYFITDLQGNNRVAFGNLPDRNVYTATMEINRQSYEESQFKFPSSSIRSNAENHTPLGSGSVALNGGLPGRSVGPAKVLTIASGDEVEIEVWAKYNTAFTSNTPVAGIISSIASAFGTAASGTGIEGHNEAFNNALNTGSTSIFTSADDNEPRAYLQYIFFDENYNFIEAGSNFREVTDQSLGKFAKYETGKVSYDQPGYLFVYLVNETQEDQNVYFDDLKITHSSAHQKFKITQVNDYYPYGMPMSNSWRSPGYVDPGLLYQSSYASYDSLTGYYDFLSRSYDPVLGRFFAVDPAGQFGSPYAGMGNVPHFGVDPDGEFVHILIGAAIGGLINLGVKAYQGKINSVWDGVKAFGIGAAAGAVGAATGGAAFVAAGGAAGGVGGFAAGAFAGMVGSAFSMPILSVGNHIGFGDPLMTGREYLTGILVGGVVGGSINGISALANGRTFWSGSLRGQGNVPNVTPLPNIQRKGIEPLKEADIPEPTLKRIEIKTNANAPKPAPKTPPSDPSKIDTKGIRLGGDGLDDGLSLKPFVRANFRENLKRLTGVNPSSDMHAHHIIPNQFAKNPNIVNAGINVHSPTNGIWVPRSFHSSLHSAGYNAEWSTFLSVTRSAAQIRQFSQYMLVKYGLY